MDKNDILNCELIQSLGLIRPWDIFIDAGANLGEYSAFALSLLGNTGHVYAIELDPLVSGQLRQRFQGVENITILNLALSNEDSIVDFYHHKLHSKMNSLYAGEDSFLAGKMQCGTLDKILSSVPAIGVLKVDIEGSEKVAIFGMVEALKKTRVLFFENHDPESWTAAFPILSEEFVCYNIETRKKVASKEDVPYQTICIKKTNPDLIGRLEIFLDDILHNPIR